MTIKLLRLKSGEDVVAEIEEGEDGVSLWLDTPAVIIPMGDPRQGNNNVQWGFGPWAAFSKDDKVRVEKDWIVFISEPAKEIVNNYRQSFGSGIVVPEVTTKKVLTE